MAFDPLAGDPLRPDEWAQFIGQEPLKERLIKHIDAAVADLRAPGHMLLTAPPGAGKTTLARLVATRMGVPLEVLTCPVRFSTIVELIVQDEFAGVLLLDEIHRLKPSEQEDYLTLIESGYIQFRGEKYVVGWLMVIGATTEKKKIIKPLRDRFPFKPEFDRYTDEEISLIIQGMTKRLGFELPPEEAEKLATACVGTPRRARDFAFAARDLRILDDGKIPDADEILDHLRIDADGLGIDHWRYIEALQKLGGQAGLRPLCSYLNEDPAVVEEIEQVLLDQGIIKYATRGRQLRGGGYKKLKQKQKVSNGSNGLDIEQGNREAAEGVGIPG